MASEIVHDVLDLELETLEAFIPETDWNCYPYPALRKTGRKATISIRTVTLSNAYLQATIALDLGGRLIQLFDRRTQTDILPPVSTISLTDGYVRGVYCNFGIELIRGLGSRDNSLGPVEHLIHEPESEQEPAKLVIWENMLERSFQATWTLYPDEAGLELEVKDYSRPNYPGSGNNGLGLGLHVMGMCTPAEGGIGMVGFHMDGSGSTGTGIGCYFEEYTFDKSEFTPEGITLSRGNEDSLPLPHIAGTTDTWRAKLIPISIATEPLAISHIVNLGLKDQELLIQSSRHVPGAKVFVNTAKGPVEATLDLNPGKIEKLDMSNLDSPTEVLVRDSEKHLLVQSDLQFPSAYSPKFITQDEAMSEEQHARYLTRYPGGRANGYFKLAQVANCAGNSTQAMQYLDESLNANAEDAIAWWFKAALERHDPAFNPEEERTALLNAHFISPMEPMLRAEAVLSTPEGNPEPSPLMKPLLQNPESLTDAVCLLIECGFKADATRLIHEALKHENILILRVLLASILLKDTKLEFDVADQLREAAKVQPRPPYPWRTTEFNAIRDLRARFPNDPVLKDLRQIIHQGTGDWIGE
jgi:hypothetical protein